MRIGYGLALVLMLSALSLPSSRMKAEDAADPVATARGIISAQIMAFLNDDADAAYSFASPAIRNKFENKDRFFDMVRKSYTPVYHPGNYAFGKAKIMGDYVLQEVIINQADGSQTTAVYQLQKQDDMSYKINGVQMLKGASSQGI